jgi:methylated-DNA-[protein]-cysteine S-methyltransferase
LFETPIGTGAIAWGERGVTGVELPHFDTAKVRAELKRRSPASVEAPPPPEIQRAIDAMTSLLQGESADLSSVELDLEGVPAFERRVYQTARSVPAGATITYGELASRLGDARLAREVGQALARNPFPLVVPCHRVIAAGGKLGGFSARGGQRTKQRLLAIERANVSWQLPLAGLRTVC